MSAILRLFRSFRIFFVDNFDIWQQIQKFRSKIRHFCRYSHHFSARYILIRKSYANSGKCVTEPRNSSTKLAHKLTLSLFRKTSIAVSHNTGHSAHLEISMLNLLMCLYTAIIGFPEAKIDKFPGISNNAHLVVNFICAPNHI